MIGGVDESEIAAERELLMAYIITRLDAGADIDALAMAVNRFEMRVADDAETHSSPEALQ